jgi:hypothetical protein
MTRESEGNLTHIASCFGANNQSTATSVSTTVCSNPLTSDLASIRISSISCRERCVMMFVLEVGAAISVTI